MMPAASVSAAIEVNGETVPAIMPVIPENGMQAAFCSMPVWTAT